MQVNHLSRIPLFMVHGNGVDHRILKPLEATLEKMRIFDLHYIDLPGFGTCPPLENSGGLPELASWLEALIRQTAGEGRFALLGNSLGALLCQEMGRQVSWPSSRAFPPGASSLPDAAPYRARAAGVSSRPSASG
ncbi:alpha/beta fold hydrolase [Glutamicibacter nicotianae]|uniref:alpha/beta fold hydrolase n=1 Tax=Glutamicibacter nicotianae TaxID=37929 RepID=UPI00167F7123|nr:alpha/beta fold hydrolase [Glutamicibacter nicotianae]